MNVLMNAEPGSSKHTREQTNYDIRVNTNVSGLQPCDTKETNYRGLPMKS